MLTKSVWERLSWTQYNVDAVHEWDLFGLGWWVRMTPHHVMDAAYAPHAAHVAVGVPPINLPLVVKLDGPFQSLLRRLRPLQDLHREMPLVQAFIPVGNQKGKASKATEGRAGRFGYHLFGPVHPAESAHLAVVLHLLLGGVPEVVVGVPILQLLPAKPSQTF